MRRFSTVTVVFYFVRLRLARPQSVPRPRPADAADSPSMSSTARPTPEPRVSRACATGVVPTTSDPGRAGSAAGGRSRSPRRSGRGWRPRPRLPRRCGTVRRAPRAAAGVPGTPGPAGCTPAPRPPRSCRRRSPGSSPLGSTRAVSPAWALVGCWARTTVACTNGSRRAARSFGPGREGSLPSDAMSDRRRGPALHGLPHPGRGAAACRRARTPNGASASTTALTIAGGEPTVADSPMPLAPIGWCGDGVTVKPGLPVRHLHRGGDQVVHQATRRGSCRPRRRRSSPSAPCRRRRSGRRAPGPR